jgi:hypothetical protein
MEQYACMYKTWREPQKSLKCLNLHLNKELSAAVEDFSDFSFLRIVEVP